MQILLLLWPLPCSLPAMRSHLQQQQQQRLELATCRQLQTFAGSVVQLCMSAWLPCVRPTWLNCRLSYNAGLLLVAYLRWLHSQCQHRLAAAEGQLRMLQGSSLLVLLLLLHQQMERCLVVGEVLLPMTRAWVPAGANGSTLQPTPMRVMRKTASGSAPQQLQQQQQERVNGRWVTAAEVAPGEVAAVRLTGLQATGLLCGAAGSAASHLAGVEAGTGAGTGRGRGARTAAAVGTGAATETGVSERGRGLRRGRMAAGQQTGTGTGSGILTGTKTGKGTSVTQGMSLAQCLAHGLMHD